MCIFIDCWKLETENNLLHVFSFLHKMSFKNNFYFQIILVCQTNFLVSKIENYFWKQKTRRKNSYQTYPNCTKTSFLCWSFAIHSRDWRWYQYPCNNPTTRLIMKFIRIYVVPMTKSFKILRPSYINWVNENHPILPQRKTHQSHLAASSFLAEDL